MAKNYKFNDGPAAAQLDAIDDWFNAQPANTGEPAWALYATCTNDADPTALPDGTLLKWGYFNATALFGAAAASLTGASRKSTITMASVGAQTHVATGDAATLALFRDVTAVGHLVAGNMGMKGNVDVSANTPWCVIGDVTLSTADVTWTIANSVIELVHTQTG